jgi:glycosyltransferase involved in cell wall biosynthesis
MPTSSLNDTIDYVEIPIIPSDRSRPDDTPIEPTIERVKQTLDEIEELWELLPIEDQPPVPDVDYDIPEDLVLSIVVPVYNERATILDVITRLKALPIKTEIIVVDDSSTDGTRGWLETIKGASGLRVIFKGQNEGKGAALQTGFAASTGDIVVVQDADLEYDPSDIMRVIKPLVTGNADVAYGSRFLCDEHQDPSLFHRLVNRGLTNFSNLFTGLRLTDMETCHKAFRRGVIRVLDLRQRRFGFEPEVTAKIARRRFRVTEVPISYSARGYAEGKKIGVRDAFNALYCIVRYGVAE